MSNDSPNSPNYQLIDLTKYAIRLGTLGFGGPVALVGYMHRDLVENRQWISETEFKEGLTLAQLMPGPLAAQLAIYLGYVHYGVVGASVVGIVFVLPSFLRVLALGWAYVTFGGIAWMQAVFYGVGASVIGIISISAYKLTHKTLGKKYKLLWAIYLVSALSTVVTESENILLFLGAGLLVLATSKASLAELLSQIAFFFTKAGAFVFGSGLAIVPKDRTADAHRNRLVALQEPTGTVCHPRRSNHRSRSVPTRSLSLDLGLKNGG